MSGHVRPARASDAAGLARLQVVVLRERYTPLLPPGALAGLTESAARDCWAQALAGPPDSQQVLVAYADDGELAGVAAVGPATDEDCEPSLTGELGLLLVHPGRTGQGHGSRLLAAAVDGLEQAGAARALAWVLAGDQPLRDFLVGAGWTPDGSRRTLDAGSPVLEVRLHVAVGPGREG